jgi:hypothetical protein
MRRLSKNLYNSKRKKLNYCDRRWRANGQRINNLKHYRRRGHSNLRAPKGQE